MYTSRKAIRGTTFTVHLDLNTTSVKTFTATKRGNGRFKVSHEVSDWSGRSQCNAVAPPVSFLPFSWFSEFAQHASYFCICGSNLTLYSIRTHFLPGSSWSQLPSDEKPSSLMSIL